MIADVIDRFRNTTPVVNQKFLQKVKLRRNHHSVSYLKSSHVFAAQFLRSLDSKQREIEQVPSKDAFFTDYTKWLDSDDVKKCKFGQDKNLRISPVSIRISPINQKV